MVLELWSDPANAFGFLAQDALQIRKMRASPSREKL